MMKLTALFALFAQLFLRVTATIPYVDKIPHYMESTVFPVIVENLEGVVDEGQRALIVKQILEAFGVPTEEIAIQEEEPIQFDEPAPENRGRGTRGRPVIVDNYEISDESDDYDYQPQGMDQDENHEGFGAVPSAGPEERDSEGRLYGPARDLRENVHAMTQAEKLLNGLYTGPNPFLSEKTFNTFLENPQHLQAVFNFLNIDSIAWVPGMMLLKVLGRAVEVQRQDIFSYVVNLMPAPSAKDIESLEFHMLMTSLTIFAQDPAYLSDLLDAHAPVLTAAVGARLNDYNTGFHQMFVDKCANYIERELGLCLTGTCNLPPALIEYLATQPDDSELLTIRRINPIAEKTDDIIEQAFDADVQISCLWSQTGQSVELETLKTLDRLKRRFEGLSRASEIQRRFAVVHLDKKTNKLTILKSPNPAGPAVLVFSCNPNGICSLSPSISSDLFAPLDQTAFRKPGCGLRSFTVDLLPGDIVVGIPQSIMQIVNLSILIESLAKSLKHQHVMQAFWTLPCLKKITMSAPIMFGSISVPTFLQAKRLSKLDDEDLITSLSSDDGSLSLGDDDGVVLGHFDPEEEYEDQEMGQ